MVEPSASQDNSIYVTVGAITRNPYYWLYCLFPDSEVETIHRQKVS